MFVLRRIRGVMVSVLASSAEDSEFEPRSGQSKELKIGIVATPLSTHHRGVRVKTGWLAIRIMCPSVYSRTVVSVS